MQFLVLFFLFSFFSVKKEIHLNQKTTGQLNVDEILVMAEFAYRHSLEKNKKQ